VDTNQLPVMVPWIAIVVVPLAAAEIGAMASLLARGLPHAQQIVFWAGTIIALASLAFPIMRSESVSTAIWLSIPHLITWFLVVPQIARIIGDTEPSARIDRVVL
jgi:ABC-type Na+ efflux pump permease subunit